MSSFFDEIIVFSALDKRGIYRRICNSTGFHQLSFYHFGGIGNMDWHGGQLFLQQWLVLLDGQQKHATKHQPALVEVPTLRTFIMNTGHQAVTA